MRISLILSIFSLAMACQVARGGTVQDDFFILTPAHIGQTGAVPRTPSNGRCDTMQMIRILLKKQIAYPIPLIQMNRAATSAAGPLHGGAYDFRPNMMAGFFGHLTGRNTSARLAANSEKSTVSLTGNFRGMKRRPPLERLLYMRPAVAVSLQAPNCP